MNDYQETTGKPSKNNKMKKSLREFYKLDAPIQFETQLPKLDTNDFNLEEYINEAKYYDPKTLLNLENTLIQEIRNLECEKKELVYNNYTKLLSITDTIQKMKNEAEPMKPVINMLEPALEHIDTLSASLNCQSTDKDTKNA